MTVPLEIQEQTRKLEFERMLKAALMEHLGISIDVEKLYDENDTLSGISVTIVLMWDDDEIASSQNDAF